MAARVKRVVLVEDSTHEKPVVLANIRAYSKFVTPGSYLIVQDTRCGRWKPADAIRDFLDEEVGQDFTRDPRWECKVAPL